MVPLASRVVEVVAERDHGCFIHGSGCIVAGRTVLTAAHVVASASRVYVRDVNKKRYKAGVDRRFLGDAEGPGPDVALVFIEDESFELDLSPIALAIVDRDHPTGEPVADCQAIGYPQFAETGGPKAFRDTVQAFGRVPVLSKLAAGLLSLVFRDQLPQALPPEGSTLEDSPWSGMSGAPVFAGGRLLGVVTEHAPREGANSVTAVPLSALEPTPTHPLWGPGVDKPERWWRYLGVTGSDEIQRLPLRETRAQPPYLATLQEFGAALRARMPTLLNRERELADVAAFATGDDVYRMLLGDAYAGKSALLYEVISGALPDSVDVVAYFLNRRVSDADSNRFLSAVVPQLAWLCESRAVAPDRDQFNTLWQQAARRAQDTGRQLLLVVDALDEDRQSPGTPSVAALLPTAAGPHAHVLVSSRPGYDLPVDLPVSHPLKTAAVMATKLFAFEGSGELKDLAEQEIRQSVRIGSGGKAALILGMLAAAAGPLTAGDLAVLVSKKPKLVDSGPNRIGRVTRLLKEDLARSVDFVGIDDLGRCEFAHRTLLDFVRSEEHLSLPAYRERIEAWAGRWRDAGWPVGTDSEVGTPRYLLENYPAMLQADDQSQLAKLVVDVGWLDAAICSVGVDQVLAVIGDASGFAADRLSEIRAVITAQAHNLRSAPAVGRPGYALRQLALQAMESGFSELADETLVRLRSIKSLGPVPLMTTRRSNRWLALELGLHRGSVAAVTVLSDGRVVSGASDGRVLVWDPAQRGTEPSELSHASSLPMVIVEAPGRRIVTGWDDGRLLVWGADLADPPVEVGRLEGKVRALACLENLLVSGGDDRCVRLWDLSTQGSKSVELGRHDDRVRAVAVLSDGRVVSGGDDRRLLMWDRRRVGEAPIQVGCETGRITAAILVNDEILVTGGTDGRVLAWDLGQVLQTPVELGRHTDWVRDLVLLDSGLLATAGDDHKINVFDPRSPDSPAVELGRHDYAVSSLARLDADLLVSGGGDRRVRVWRTAGIRPGVPANIRPISAIQITTLSVLNDGQIVSGGEDGQVLRWDPYQPDEPPIVVGRHFRRIRSIVALPDGRVASAADDGRVLAWDLDRPGSAATSIAQFYARVRALAMLDDQWLIAGNDDKNVLMCDIKANGSQPVLLGRQQSRVRAAVVTRDRRLITGGDDGRLLLWTPRDRASDPMELGELKGRITTLTLLDDSKLASGDINGGVTIWDLSSTKSASIELGRHNDVVRTSTALEGGLLITGGDDRQIRCWNPSSGEESPAIDCSVDLVTSYRRPEVPDQLLLVAHEGHGLSMWRPPDLVV